MCSLPINIDSADLAVPEACDVLHETCVQRPTLTLFQEVGNRLAGIVIDEEASHFAWALIGLYILVWTDCNRCYLVRQCVAPSRKLGLLEWRQGVEGGWEIGCRGSLLYVCTIAVNRLDQEEFKSTLGVTAGWKCSDCRLREAQFAATSQARWLLWLDLSHGSSFTGTVKLALQSSVNWHLSVVDRNASNVHHNIAKSQTSRGDHMKRV